MKKIIYFLISITLILLTSINVNVLTEKKALYSNADEIVSSWDQINSYEELNGVELIVKDFDNSFVWPYQDFVPIIGGYYTGDNSIEILQLQRIQPNGTEQNQIYSNYTVNFLLRFVPNDSLYMGVYGTPNSSVNFSLFISSAWTTKLKFLNLNTQYIDYDFTKFKANLMVALDIYTEPQTYIKINIENENIINNINYVEINYSTSSNDYSLRIEPNQAINIYRYISDGINELVIKIKYIQLPKYYGKYIFDNPGYLILQSKDDSVEESIINLIKDDIVYSQNNEIFNISLDQIIPTINLLSNTTWFLNPTLSFDYTNIHQLSLLPKETARQGYYIAYNYNVNEVINEYMYFNDDEFPDNYEYLVNLGFKNTIYHYDFYLYDNVNYINGEIAASGFNLYDFTSNSYIDNFGVVPRIISFSHLFNTNNLNERLIFKDTASDFTPLYFYDFILNNATEFTAEQYETYNSGYNVGYTVGVDFATESTKWISAVFSAVDDIFQVEILPNFKLWYLIGIPLLLLAVVFIFKLLR